MQKSARGTWGAATVLLSCAALLAGCGEAADDDPEPTRSTTVETSPTTDATATSDGGTSATPGVITVAQGQEHRITDPGTVLVTCDGGGDVKVVAVATVTIAGECEDIDVEAEGATVTFETTRDLDVEGSGNTVTGVRALDLDVGGDRNQITVRQLRAVDAEGSDNVVKHGTALTPRVDDEGRGNSIGEG
jgi:hypothetical protein